MSAPVLDQMNLVVSDMTQSIDFYRAVGLEIPESTVWRTATGAHHVVMKMPTGLNWRSTVMLWLSPTTLAGANSKVKAIGP